MIQIIDLSQNKSKVNNYLSQKLLDEIKSSLGKKEKIILYMNRRGTHRNIICSECGWIDICPNCDINLSIHENENLSICHTCEFSKKIPCFCQNCSGTKLEKKGVGTKQIEENLKKIFKDKKIFRFDRDNLKKIQDKKNALENLKNSDIIIGTKMITTGFDFEKVGLIAVILMEQEVAYPSFDTQEQVYNTLKQLFGRGNRKKQKTKILIQTYQTSSEMIKNISEKNYKDYFINTLKERKNFNYPPFFEMSEIIYKNENKEKSEIFIKNLQEEIKNFIGEKENHSQTLVLSNLRAFKKKNFYETTLTIKGKNIQDILDHIHKKILYTNGASIRHF